MSITRNFLKIALVIMWIVALFAIFYGDILTSYAKFFSVDNAKKGADSILILAGNSYPRTSKAMELLNDGYAKNILITTPKEESIKDKYRDLFKFSDSQITKEILKRENIEPIRIKSLKDGATSTFDEAYDLVNYLKTNPLKRVILVTDSFHSRRALYAFEKVFELNNIETKLEISSAQNEFFNEQNWYKTEEGLNAYISEFFKFIIYILNSTNLKGIEES